MAAYAAYVALPLVPALICVTGVALSAGVQVGRSLHWWRDSVRELRLRPDGGVAWRAGDGGWHTTPEVSGGTLVPWLTVIGLKEDGRRLQPLLLLPDSLESDKLRELRVWLRWRPPAHPKPGIRVN